jgi:hypothetical protein
MTLSDGILTFTTTGEFVNDSTNLEGSQSKSVGGSLKQQIAGERFVMVEKIRLTGAEYRSLMTIIKGNSAYYSFTPTYQPDYMPAGSFPMQVTIAQFKKEAMTWNGRRYYIITLEIHGVNVI